MVRAEAPSLSRRDAPDHGHEPAGPERPRGVASRERPRAGFVVAFLTGLLALPLIVAAVVLRDPRWYPLGDLAWTELRVRDVFSADPPLVGLAGRIGTLGAQGNHPGPLSFWALAPFYRAFGATAWALQAAATCLNVIAIGAVLWMAHRRGGVRLALGAALLVALLATGYGASTLTEAWNPYLPVLWWMTFLFAVWGVVDGDPPLVPVAVFAGSFCVQTHVSYLGLVPVLLALSLAVALVPRYARRRNDPTEWRTFGRWTLGAGALGMALWLPPIIDQLTGSPGNLSLVQRTFTEPEGAPIGISRGVELVLVHLDPWRLLTGDDLVSSIDRSVVPGVVLLVAWAGSALIARRLREPALVRLNLVLGVALVLGMISASRIYGVVWPYLALWAWGLNALMLLALGWTIVSFAGRRLREPARARLAVGVVPTLAGLLLLVTVLFTIDAAHTRVTFEDLSTDLGRLAAPTVNALEDGATAGRGRDARYLVTWVDPIAIGSQGSGLALELERAGFDVGIEEPYENRLGPQRVRDPDDADTRVHLAAGADVEVWRAKPEFEQVAYLDPRSAEQREEFTGLRARVIAELEEAGLTDEVPRVDANLFTLAVDDEVPDRTRRLVVEMLDLGVPSAVFVGPPDAAD